MSVPAPSERQPVAELERQVERGSLFTHACLEAVSDRLSRAESLLVELMAAMGPTRGEPGAEASAPVVEEDPSCVPGAGESQASEPSEGGWREGTLGDEMRWPAIAMGVEDPNASTAPPVEVNCAARMHVCKGVCCKLAFALTPGEVESGSVKWDLGYPYMIRHGSDGYCVHSDSGSRRCGVYADRPSVCRRYSCANDPRIWKDFEGMVLNQEWIDEKLASRGRILVIGPRPRMEEAIEDAATS